MDREQIRQAVIDAITAYFDSADPDAPHIADWRVEQIADDVLARLPSPTGAKDNG